MENPNESAVSRRRRRKTKFETIKEAYLPYIFLLVTLVLVTIFVAVALLR